MPTASGVNKIVVAKREASWGVLPVATGAQTFGRITSDLSLAKESYASEEIVSHYQQSDVRHGVRSVRGNLRGEIAPGAQQMFFEAALRRLFTAVTAISGLTVTVSGSGPTYTVNRSAGDWLAGGAKIGMGVRLSGGTLAAANQKNLIILGVTASDLTVLPLNGVAMSAQSSIASVTATFPGKVTHAPAAGHTDDSFSIEHWFSDIAQSERFVGCKVNTLGVDLPPTGLSKIDIAFMGKDMSTGTAAYFTTPTVASTAGKLAAVNGVLTIAGAPVALLTGLNFSINGNMSSEPVVGSNTYPDIYEGRIIIDGQATLLFQDAVARDYFINETEVGLVGAFATGNADNADFMSFSMPRIKFKSAGKSDGEKSIVQTMAFDALYYGAGGAALASQQTSMQLHDSLAV